MTARIDPLWDKTYVLRVQVTVSNLQEGSTYYYKVGDPTKPNGVSPVFHFKVLLARARTSSFSSNMLMHACVAQRGAGLRNDNTDEHAVDSAPCGCDALRCPWPHRSARSLEMMMCVSGQPSA